MKKMLYIMSVDWGWIPQRPHFIAYELQKYYKIRVVYTKQIIKRWRTQKKMSAPKGWRCGFYFPLQNRIKFLKIISDFSMKMAIGKVKEYDIVVVGSPDMYRFIDKFEGIVIYDCMDNYVAMEKNETARRKIQYYQKLLLKRTDYILVSSMYLKKMIEKEETQAEVVLVRNGYNATDFYKVKTAEIKKNYLLGYIGTISSWMNFKILIECLNIYPDIEIRMIGPSQGGNKIQHKGLIYEGVIEHTDLYKTIEDYDCLMMPFIVNDVVLAVDPVKLYEYISYGKCIISIYYPEVEPFQDFVYFYNSDREFIEIIGKLKDLGFPSKYNEEQQKNFLKNNSWTCRGRIITDIIKGNKMQISREQVKINGV